MVLTSLVNPSRTLNWSRFILLQNQILSFQGKVPRARLSKMAQAMAVLSVFWGFILTVRLVRKTRSS